MALRRDDPTNPDTPIARKMSERPMDILEAERAAVIAKGNARKRAKRAKDAAARAGDSRDSKGGEGKVAGGNASDVTPAK